MQDRYLTLEARVRRLRERLIAELVAYGREERVLRRMRLEELLEERRVQVRRMMERAPSRRSQG